MVDRSRRARALVLALLILVPTGASGQAEPAKASTPQRAMLDFLEASRDGDYARASEDLDLRRIAPDRREREGQRLARRLKVVLDRELWVDVDALSTEPEGDTDDELPPGRDLVGRIQSANGPVDVSVERGPDGVWRVSRNTVAAIPELYREFGYGPLGDRLPSVLLETRLLEAELWQWIGLLLLAMVAYLLGWLAALAVMRGMRPLVSRSETDFDDRVLNAVVGPLRLILFVVLVALGSPGLRLSLPVQRALDGFEKAAAVVAVTWFLLRFVDVLAELAAHRLNARGREPATQFVPLGRKAIKLVMVTLAALAALDSIGFDVTALIAGLGVGGLAVALAAQRTVENLFGGITLLADRPVAVGDFCRFGDKIGTIEEIGLRSTRVRTLDRTVVTVPNAEFSREALENFAVRDKMRLAGGIGLRYETSPDQLRFVLSELRRMLQEHPRVTPDPARVRFVGFGASSLDLDIFAYIDTDDWNEYLAIREDIYLRIMNIVEEAGTGFAFPSQTLYLGQDDGLDPERTRTAEAKVATWRQEGRLPFPDMTDAEKRELQGRPLDYPPQGSAAPKDPVR